MALVLGVHVVHQGSQLPHLEGLSVGPGEPEPMGDECQVDYSSPSVGSTLAVLALILRAPACSQVKSGSSRRFTM